MLLVKSQSIEEPISLDELMKYPLTPVPRSLGTADGFFNKTNKAAVLHFLLEDVAKEELLPSDAFYIQDGNALFHSLTNLQPTFGNICLQILDQMVSKKNFLFSTDSYHMGSIKAQERLRRGFAQRYVLKDQQQGDLVILSCSWLMSTTNHNCVSFCFRSGKAWQQQVGFRKVKELWWLLRARHISYIGLMVM